MNQSTTSPTLANQTPHGYAAAPLHVLHILEEAVVDLYVEGDRTAGPQLFCRAGCAFDEERRAELAMLEVERLLVRASELHALSVGLSACLESILQQEFAPGEKYAVLQLAVSAEFERSLKSPDPDAYCAVVEKTADNLVELVRSGPLLPGELYAAARHEHSSSVHAVNVAGYSVMLAERLGTTEPDVLRQIAAGAMLHDAGKRFLPPELLAKSGLLTRSERQLIESHPTRGYLELRARSDLTFGQLMMVYQHHERPDGTGYPVGVDASEIHPWAKLLAVVDVFDAITCKRPYRPPLSLPEALAYQREHAGSQFDEETLQCWSDLTIPA